MAKFAVIIPAAGQSTRFQKGGKKKSFLDLKGRPVWVRTAEIFTSREDVGQVIVVIAAEDREWFREKYQANLAFMNVLLVDGGKERADSVERGLKVVDPAMEYVAVHDGARPLVVKKWVDEVFGVAVKTGAAILAVPITSTIKRSENGRVVETVDRKNLWAAQTPQVFQRELLEKAYKNRGNFNPTDEAQLVEKMGHAVSIVEGNPMNIKITTADDFRMAEAMVDLLPKEKSLDAFHPFAEDNLRYL